MCNPGNETKYYLKGLKKQHTQQILLWELTVLTVTFSGRGKRTVGKSKDYWTLQKWRNVFPQSCDGGGGSPGLGVLDMGRTLFSAVPEKFSSLVSDTNPCKCGLINAGRRPSVRHGWKPVCCKRNVHRRSVHVMWSAGKERYEDLCSSIWNVLVRTNFVLGILRTSVARGRNGRNLGQPWRSSKLLYSSIYNEGVSDRWRVFA